MPFASSNDASAICLVHGLGRVLIHVSRMHPDCGSGDLQRDQRRGAADAGFPDRVPADACARAGYGGGDRDVPVSGSVRFRSPVFRYLRLRLADLSAVRSLVALTLPAGVLGAVLGEHVPGQWLRIGYDAAMLGVAWLIGSTGRKTDFRRPDRPCPCLVCESECSEPECAGPDRRSVRAADGQRYDYCASGMGWQRVFSGAGAVLTGMISTGVGEATLPTLVRRSRFPVPVAAATSTLVVAGTVVGAAATHLIQLTASGGLDSIPWNLIVWAVPGAVLGALAGTRFQGRVSEKLTRRFFSVLFVAIGLAFLMAFTVFNGAFNAR